ncbi:MAG: hypothetical protein AAGC55_05650 [Myxococcota bacterium]
MSQIPYETIAPLIASAEQRGSAMVVTFRCPVSGHTVDASGAMRATAPGVGDRAMQSAKRSLGYSLSNALTRSIRRALGYNVLGRMAADMAQGATSSIGSSRSEPSFSEDDKRAAIAAAFESVSNNFIWDAQNNRYISAESAGQVMTDFMRILNEAPANLPYDRGILARMLTEIACADGSIGDDERGFLSGFVTPEIGTVDSLAQMKALSSAELSETSPGAVRETMLMLAWGLALTDESLAPDEAIRLDQYANGLAIEQTRAHELRSYAQIYLVDQALGRAYPGGRRDEQAHAEVMAMAVRLGMDPNEAERVDIRFRKRYGLV